MTSHLDPGFYSARVASRVARIKYQNFQAWAKAGLVKGKIHRVGRRAETIYTYKDLLLIRLIVRLKQQGAKPKAIRVALDTIRLMSNGDTDAWMNATLLVDAGYVIALIPERPNWNPIAASKGPQKIATVFFPELIQQLRDELVPPERFPHIEVDPRILGGAPVIRGTRIPTRAVLAVRESGVAPQVAYPSLTPEQIDNAQSYEEFLEAA